MGEVVIERGHQAAKQDLSSCPHWFLDSQQLSSMLRQVSGVVEAAHTIKILSFYMIEVCAGEMTIYATDGNMQISASHKVDGVYSGAIRVTVCAKKLNDIARTLPRGERVTLYAASNWIHLRSEMASFQLLCLPSEEFPTLKSDDGLQSSFSVDAALFSALLQRTAFAMAVSDVRAYLNGLFVTCEQGEVVVAGSDGHRMSLGTSSHLKAFSKASAFFMSRKLVVELMKLLRGLDAHEAIQFFVGDKFFRIQAEAFEVISTLQPVPDLSYMQLIPKHFMGAFSVDRAMLKTALSHCMVLSDAKFARADVAIGAQSMEVVAYNFDQEQIKSCVEVTGDCSAVKVALNVAYLYEVAQTVSCDQLHVQVVKENQSIFVSEDSDQMKAYYLIMPLLTHHAS